MAGFQRWISQWVRREVSRQMGPSGTQAIGRAWRVTPPSDPTEPLWLVPAYQRQRQSGDRPLAR